MTPILAQQIGTGALVELHDCSTMAHIEIHVANRSGSGETFDIALLPAGVEAVAAEHYLYAGATVGSNSTTKVGPVYLNAGDKVMVNAGGNVTFTANGYEHDGS